MLTITPDFEIPLTELRFTFVRSSGPGGQNVNKVASKAILRWTPGERLSPEVAARFATTYPAHWTKEGQILITSQRTRDALKNREDCLEKLREMLLVVLKRPKRRIPTRPTKGSVQRRLDQKNRDARKKENRKRVDW